MKDIVLIESFTLNENNDIVVTAIVEDMIYVPKSQTMIDPPEYAPCRCKITIPNDHLPDDATVIGASESELEEIINKHININNYDWVIDVEDVSDDEPEIRYSSLFF